MNHKSTSYVNTIKKAKDIWMNYYINKKDFIFPEVDKIIKQFEDIIIVSIQRQINLIYK